MRSINNPKPNHEDGPRPRSQTATSGAASGAAGSDDAYFRAAAATLTALPDRAEPNMSATLLNRHYGLAGTITPLSSEVERTEEVRLPDGRGLILKTSGQPETSDSFAFQASALAGLDGASGFVVPQLIHTGRGSVIFEDTGVCGYLQTRIDGVPLHRESRPPTCFSAPAVLSAGSTWRWRRLNRLQFRDLCFGISGAGRG